jgi:hypothetical protein
MRDFLEQPQGAHSPPQRGQKEIEPKGGRHSKVRSEGKRNSNQKGGKAVRPQGEFKECKGARQKLCPNFARGVG